MINIVETPPAAQTPDEMVDNFEVKAKDLFTIDGFFESKPLRCGFPTFEAHKYLREAQPDLCVIAARPGAGKTALVSQIALETSKHSPVLLFSLEMTAQQLANRILAVESQVPIAKLHTLTMAERANLQARLSRRQFKVDDTNGLTINELMGRAIDLHARKPLGLIVVDYLQIVCTQGMRSKAEEVAYVAEKLKTLAKQLQVPVLALAQMNRMFDSRVADNPTAQPMMADLADSAGIEKWSDVVMILHRPKDFPGVCKGFVLKNRNGVALDFEFKFIGETTRFVDPGVGAL